MRKQKYYVIWVGWNTGIVDTWDQCKQAIKGFPNAKFMAFDSLASANAAFSDGWESHWGTKTKLLQNVAEMSTSKPHGTGLCVDAACNVETRVMEYRGVWYPESVQAFHQEPIYEATNNVGEFLAIVHGLALLKRVGRPDPVYSDSATALSWVSKRLVKSAAVGSAGASAIVEAKIALSLRWLNDNTDHNPVFKWKSSDWGENPADFGRK